MLLDIDGWLAARGTAYIHAARRGAARHGTAGWCVAAGMGKDRAKPGTRHGASSASSSGAAASVPSAFGSVTSIGFGGFVGQQRVGEAASAGGGSAVVASSGPASAPSVGGGDSLDSRLGSVDGECAVALRRLTKRDTTTKLKALAALRERLRSEELDGTAAAALLPAWTYAYGRLVLDLSRAVREAAASTLRLLVRQAGGKQLAAHLRPLVGAWWLARFDEHAAAASEADGAWGDLLTTQAKRQAAAVAHRSALVDAMAAYLAHTPQTLSDMRNTSKEEAADRHARAHAAALAALGDLAATAAAARLAGLGDKVTKAADDTLARLAQALAGQDAKTTTLASALASKVSTVRGAAYRLVIALCGAAQAADADSELDAGEAALRELIAPARSAKAVIGALGDKGECQAELWTMLLTYLKAFPAAWTAMDARKAVLPRLWANIRAAAAGDARAVAPCLAPLLAIVPAEMAVELELAQGLLDAIFPAAESAHADNRAALLQAGAEVAAFAAANAGGRFRSAAGDEEAFIRDVLVDGCVSRMVPLLAGDSARAEAPARALARLLSQLAASKAAAANAALGAAARALIAAAIGLPAPNLTVLVQALSDAVRRADGAGLAPWAAEHIGRPLIAALEGRADGALTSAGVCVWAMMPAEEREARMARALEAQDFGFVAGAATEADFLSDSGYAAALRAVAGALASDGAAQGAGECAARVLRSGLLQHCSDEVQAAYEDLVVAFVRSCWESAELLDLPGGSDVLNLKDATRTGAVRRLGAGLCAALRNGHCSASTVADRAAISLALVCTDEREQRALVAAVLGDGSGSLDAAGVECAQRLVEHVGTGVLLWCDNGLWLAVELLAAGGASAAGIANDVASGEVPSALVVRLTSLVVHCWRPEACDGLRAMLEGAARATAAWDADAAIAALESVLSVENDLGPAATSALVPPLASVIRRAETEDEDDEPDLGDLNEFTVRWCEAAAVAVRKHGPASDDTREALKCAAAALPAPGAAGHVGGDERDALVGLAGALRKARLAGVAAAKAQGDDKSDDGTASGAAEVAAAWLMAVTHAWHLLEEEDRTEVMTLCDVWLKPAGMAVEEEAAGARMDASAVGWRPEFAPTAAVAAQVALAAFSTGGTEAVSEEVWAVSLRLVVGAGSVEAAAEEGEGGGVASATKICTARYRGGEAALWSAVADLCVHAPNDAVEDASEIAELVAAEDEGVEMAPALLTLMLSPRPHPSLRRAAYALLCKPPLQEAAVRAVDEDEDEDEDEEDHELAGAKTDPASVARIQPRLAAVLEAPGAEAAGPASPLRPGYLLGWALLLQRAALCLPESPDRVTLLTYVRNAELAPALLSVVFQHVPAALAAPKGAAAIEAATALATSGVAQVDPDKLPLTPTARHDPRVLMVVAASLAWGPALVADKVLPKEADAEYLVAAEGGAGVAQRPTATAADDDNTSCDKGTDTAAAAASARDASLAGLAAALYALALRVLPAAARQWFGAMRERGMRASVEAYTSSYVSPALLEAELAAVSSGGPSSEGLGGELSVRASRAARLVSASYVQDEATLEMTVALPAAYPLLPLEVGSTRNVGVPQATLRKWLLSISAYLRLHDGAVVEAVRMWKSNLDKTFEGVEECSICYSVLHAANHALPRMQCRTCKHKFHSACMYRWVQTSGKNTCPLCQSPFTG